MPAPPTGGSPRRAPCIDGRLGAPRRLSLPESEYQESRDGGSASARQIRSGVSGVIEVADAEVGEGVDDGVVHRRGRADRARLADALGAELVDDVGVSMATSSNDGSSAAEITA